MGRAAGPANCRPSVRFSEGPQGLPGPPGTPRQEFPEAPRRSQVLSEPRDSRGALPEFPGGSQGFPGAPFGLSCKCNSLLRFKLQMQLFRSGTLQTQFIEMEMQFIVLLGSCAYKSLGCKCNSFRRLKLQMQFIPSVQVANAIRSFGSSCKRNRTFGSRSTGSSGLRIVGADLFVKRNC